MLVIEKVEDYYRITRGNKRTLVEKLVGAINLIYLWRYSKIKRITIKGNERFTEPSVGEIFTANWGYFFTEPAESGITPLITPLEAINTEYVIKPYTGEIMVSRGMTKYIITSGKDLVLVQTPVDVSREEHLETSREAGKMIFRTVKRVKKRIKVSYPVEVSFNIFEDGFMFNVFKGFASELSLSDFIGGVFIGCAEPDGRRVSVNVENANWNSVPFLFAIVKEIEKLGYDVSADIVLYKYIDALTESNKDLDAELDVVIV